MLELDRAGSGGRAAIGLQSQDRSVIPPLRNASRPAEERSPSGLRCEIVNLLYGTPLTSVP